MSQGPFGKGDAVPWKSLNRAILWPQNGGAEPFGMMINPTINNGGLLNQPD